MATLQENITTIQDTLDDIHDAIIAKGGTTSGTDITSYASGITNIPQPIGIPCEVSSQGIFEKNKTITSFSLPNGTTSLKQYIFYYAFYNLTSLTSVDFSSLTTLHETYSLAYAFQDCTSLSNVDFSNLTVYDASNVFTSAFRNCTSLQTLSFPALTSTSFGNLRYIFNNMIIGVTGCTVHFPSNLQSVIGNWSSVTSGFGGTNTTVLFDLPATT